eukprot:493320_1
MPLKTRSIKVKLNGFVKYVHSTKVGNAGRQFVSIDKTFNINKMEDTYKFGSFYLNKCENNEYFISLLGKNGEPMVNKVCLIKLYCNYFNGDPLKHKLKTDVFGRIYLTKLAQNVSSIFIEPFYENDKKVINNKRWELQNNY